MILIIETPEPSRLGHHVQVNSAQDTVTLGGTFKLVASFEVVERDDDGDANVIQAVWPDL